MEKVDLLGMFMLGLLGTGHCVGMCGPLVFAFPGRSGRFMSHVWYHLGRVTTYVAVGAVLGGVGALLGALLFALACKLPRLPGGARTPRRL